MDRAQGRLRRRRQRGDAPPHVRHARRQPHLPPATPACPGAPGSCEQAADRPRPRLGAVAPHHPQPMPAKQLQLDAALGDGSRADLATDLLPIPDDLHRQNARLLLDGRLVGREPRVPQPCEHQLGVRIAAYMPPGSTITQTPASAGGTRVWQQIIRVSASDAAANVALPLLC